MKVIGERIGVARPLKYFSDAAKTQNDSAGAQPARGSRRFPDTVAPSLVPLNILRDDRDSTVNRATARRQDLARPAQGDHARRATEKCPPSLLSFSRRKSEEEFVKNSIIVLFYSTNVHSTYFLSLRVMLFIDMITIAILYRN
jgi:hypothetical protein